MPAVSGTGRSVARAELEKKVSRTQGGDAPPPCGQLVPTVATDSCVFELGCGGRSRRAMPASEVGGRANRRLVPVSNAVCIEPRVDSTRCAAHGGRASNLAPSRSGQRGLPAAVLLPVVMAAVVGLLLPEATVRCWTRAPCLCLGLSCCVSSLIFPVCCRCVFLPHRVSDRARRARRQLE